MLKSYQHKPKEKISWLRPWNRHTRPTQIDQMCCQLWGWIDLLLHFLCLLLSLIKVNLQRREGKIDLFHVALLSFLFWDLPGLWPLTKNCIYWIYSGWLLFKLKKVIINCPWEMQQCVCCKDVAATMIQWFTHCSFYEYHGDNTSGLSRVFGFPVTQEFIFVLWILWMCWLDLFSSSFRLPRSLKPTLWSNFKKRFVCLTCILCIYPLMSLYMFSFCSSFPYFGTWREATVTSRKQVCF